MDTNTAWQTLRDYAEGRIGHTYAGSCPDHVEGHDSRDPECLVCQALEAVAGAAPAAVAPQGERQWICPTRTVADLVNNLLTLDQALPAYGAQYIEKDGRRCAIAVPPTVSRERVKDGRWIGQGEELNAAVIWTRAEQPAAVAGPADELAELAMLNKLIELGAKASYAHAKSNSDDGPAGTAAYVQWQELRAEMGELIRAHVAPALEAPAGPGFGLDAEQLERLRTNGLKPEEISGAPDVQHARVRELLHWFARLATGHANPKWLSRHAMELAYYLGTEGTDRGLDIEAIKKASYLEGVNISAQDRGILERLGTIPVAAPQAPAAPSAHAGLLAAAAHIQAKAQAHLDERGSYDPDTGAVEMSESNQEHFNTLDELAEEIRMMAEKAAPASCDKPPADWTCSRAPGHDGPCAAAPAAPAVDASDMAALNWLRRNAEVRFSLDYERVEISFAAPEGLTGFNTIDEAIAAAQAKEGGESA